jgi:hypothetical protein
VYRSSIDARENLPRALALAVSPSRWASSGSPRRLNTLEKGLSDPRDPDLIIYPFGELLLTAAARCSGLELPE